ncbi:MAG: LysR family transcriptional regulator [Acidimicrobiia bacterium]|nr:LysR family transcriptional regulator [Acidimicrobiia bacterium]
MLSLNELRVFLIAAETENFSETARRLGISQPAVSMQIRALERRFGMDLFERSGRAVSLTEAGQVLVPLARDLVHRSIFLQEAMASMEGEVVGMLNLVCTTTAGKYILPRLLARFQDQHPRVELACLVMPREMAIRRLIEDEAHIGVASVVEATRGLECRPFMTDHVGLIAPPDHRWAVRGGPIKPDELKEERYITREEVSGTSVAVSEALAWHDIAPSDLKRSMTLGNSEAILMAVQEGIGLGFVSTMVAAEALAAGTLAMIPIEGMDITKTLYMIRSTEVASTAAAAAFWESTFSTENQQLLAEPSLVAPGP